MTLYNFNDKTVSIILPTYNRKKLISRAINSVLNQKYRNWELLIIDDGSTDGTFKVIEHFLAEHSNIKYFYQSNKGAALAMNKGIELSEGDLVTFLGSDDEYESNHIKLRVDYLESHPDVDLLHSPAKIIGDEYVKDKNDLTKLIHLSECILGGTFFGKKEVFCTLGGFKKVSYSPESEFIERAKMRFKIVKLNKPTYIYYRDTPDSICNTI